MGKPESPKYDFSTGAGIFAAAMVVGLMAGGAINQDKEQEPTKIELTSAEIESCRGYARDRAMKVCQEIFCGKFLMRDIEKEIETDCSFGVIPEPGTDADKCDLEGLQKAGRAYLHKGEKGYNFDEIRDSVYSRCITETIANDE